MVGCEGIGDGRRGHYAYLEEILEATFVGRGKIGDVLQLSLYFKEKTLQCSQKGRVGSITI